MTQEAEDEPRQAPDRPMWSQDQPKKSLESPKSKMSQGSPKLVRDGPRISQDGPKSEIINECVSEAGAFAVAFLQAMLRSFVVIAPKLLVTL